MHSVHLELEQRMYCAVGSISKLCDRFNYIHIQQYASVSFQLVSATTTLIDVCCKWMLFDMHYFALGWRLARCIYAFTFSWAGCVCDYGNSAPYSRWWHHNRLEVGLGKSDAALTTNRRRAKHIAVESLAKEMLFIFRCKKLSTKIWPFNQRAIATKNINIIINGTRFWFWRKTCIWMFSEIDWFSIILCVNLLCSVICIGITRFLCYFVSDKL